MELQREIEKVGPFISRDIIIYKGQRYIRNPNTARRQHRVYYWKHDKWKTIPVALHRQIYMDEVGEIPEGYCIHHKDENTFNNDISNLECLSASDHMRRHPFAEEVQLKNIERTKQNKGKYLQEWRDNHPDLAKKLYEENGKKSQGLKRWRETTPKEDQHKQHVAAGKKGGRIYKIQREKAALGISV